MKIYLAARYSRRLELCSYREQLRCIGHTVNAVWLNGEHQISNEGIPIGESGEQLVEITSDSRNKFYDQSTDCAAKLRQKFAQDDYNDVSSCEQFVAFTEEPRSGHSRGGRHVELGIALALLKEVIIVGPRENIFCWLPTITQFDNFDLYFQFMLSFKEE
jgi:hypothetical protein